MATNKFQLLNRKPPDEKRKSKGIITHAIAIKKNFSILEKVLKVADLQKIPGNRIMPSVQNISIQHNIFSRCLVG